MSKKKAFLVLVIFGLVVHFSLLIVASGIFRDVTDLGLEKCQSLIGINGPEDFSRIKSSGEVFVSSDERLNGNALSPRNGAIFLLNSQTLEKQNLTPEIPFEFHPHGIDIWESPTETLLYVINHRHEFSSIEVFKWDGVSLVHEKTIQNDVLINPNDIVVIGKDQFYVSHDHGSKNFLLKKLETYSRIGRGFVTFYEKEEFHVMANFIPYANGMVVSHSQDYLYVASMLGKKIEVFAIAKNHQLKHYKTVKLEFAPDNLSLDDDGSLLVSGHSKLFALQSHMKDHTKFSPFEIFRITEPYQAAIQTKIMSGDGKSISGVSVAYPVGNQLLLGTIFLDKLLICPKL
jgi:hypothetical protein